MSQPSLPGPRAGATSFRLYPRALRLARPWWPHLGVMLGLGFIWTPISLLLLLPVKIILDSVTGAQPLPAWLAWWPGPPADPAGRALAVALALSVGVTAHVLVHNTAEWLLRESLSDGVVRDLRSRLAARALERWARGQRARGQRARATTPTASPKTSPRCRPSPSTACRRS